MMTSEEACWRVRRHGFKLSTFPKGLQREDLWEVCDLLPVFVERLEYVGRGAPAAIARRATAAGTVLARRAACTFWRGPRIPGIYGDL